MKTSRIFLITIIVFMMIWVGYLFMPFWLPISIGVLISMSTAGLHAKILKKCRNHKFAAAFITTFILCVLFFVPFIYAIIAIAKNAMQLDMHYFNQIFDYVKNFDFSLPSPLKDFEPKIKEFIAGLNFAGITKQVVAYLSTIGKSSANFIMDMGLIIVFYFFANFYASDFSKFIKKVAPISKDELDYILNEATNTMSVVFYSTIFNAVLQGFLFSIIAKIYGFDAILFGILFAFASLIPVIGGALIFVPLGLYELASGDIKAAIVIALYTIIVISTIADSFIKPLMIGFINSKLVNNPANISEMLIFFAMIAGMATFGFWGMILGPAILTLFVSVLNIYTRESMEI